MKKIIVLLLVVGAVFFTLSVAKNAIAKTAVQSLCQTMTGLELHIRRLNIGVLTTLIDIQDLRLHNPPEFQDRVMFDLSEVYVDYNLRSILSGKVHLEELRLDLKELTIIRNEQGQLNLDSLKAAGAKKKAPEEKEAAREAAPAEEKKELPEIQIDRLVLKVGKVIYKDYSKGPEPNVQEFDVNLNETYENISNIQALVPLIVSKALINTTIAKLANYDMNDFMSQFDAQGLDLGEVGLDQFEGLATEAQGFLSQITESGAQGQGGDFTKAADEAAEGLKQLFGGLGGQ